MTNLRTLDSQLRYRLPAAHRRESRSSWGDVNFPGVALDCFLEGPSFDRDGSLYVVDIPYGRIFRISEAGEWYLHTSYDGWPNGLKIHQNGDIYIADYRRGILRLPQGLLEPEDVAARFRSEGFKGCNDLFFTPDGTLYFTDQGQTGLHDPTGRVFSKTKNGGLSLLIDTIPSPNGIVSNSSGTQLYVAVTRANAVWRLPLMSDGTVTKVGVFIQLSGGIAGPDGLAMDVEDGLVVCHPGLGVWRFDRRGRPTHLIEAPEGSVWTNIAFGGEDHRELFIVDSVAGEIHTVLMPHAGSKLYSHC